MRKRNRDLAAFTSTDPRLARDPVSRESTSLAARSGKSRATLSPMIRPRVLVSDFLYLTRLGLIFFGFEQLAPCLAHVVAGLIDAVLNAVHHFALPYRTRNRRGRDSKGGREKEGSSKERTRIQAGRSSRGQPRGGGGEWMHPELHLRVHIAGE